MFHTPSSVAADRRQSPLLFLLLWLALHSPAAAQTCNSAPIAVDDAVDHLGEPIVVDVLANDIEPDGEALAITSVATTCAGTLSHDFGLVRLVPPLPPGSEACAITYQVADESGNTADGTVSVVDGGVVFKDGFETGDTSYWQ